MSQVHRGYPVVVGPVSAVAADIQVAFLVTVGFADFPAFRAGLACVGRVNEHDFLTVAFRLVSDFHNRKAISSEVAFSIALRRGNVLQNFLAGFGGVGGACALITLGLKVWPGALDALATGLYSHVRPERLPYDSPLSQHFAKTRQLGERTAKFDDRMDELCRDTIKNTLISLIYGDQSHDHSEAVRYELAKLEKLDAQCWIISAAEKYLEDRQ